ncbi:MAG TPA: PAS domain S-box protein [Terriglobales bacterium]|nr:PAS domain S-box protein [Terriglobales bacterium]
MTGKHKVDEPGKVNEINRRAEPSGGDLFRDLVEHSQDLICTHDLTGRLLSMNPLPARLLGYEVEELLARPMRGFLAPEFRDQFDDYLKRIQENGADAGVMVLQTRSGERRVWEYHNTLRTDGPTPVVRGMAHDITERHRAEVALRKSEERFRVALKNSPTVVFHQDRDLRYTWINTPTLPWADEECIGRSDAEIIGGEEGARISWIKQGVLDRGAGAREEISITARGEERYFDLTVEPLRNSAGATVGITCACSDITPLKRLLQERERLIATLQNTLEKVKLLTGMLATCAYCKKIRDDQGVWHVLEAYIQDHSEASFTHGICPDCVQKHYPAIPQAKLPT